jgi:hypothetical protein
MYNWKHVNLISKWGDNSKAESTVEVFEPGYFYLDLIYKGEDRMVWKTITDKNIIVQNQQAATKKHQQCNMGILEFKTAEKYTFSVSLVDGDELYNITNDRAPEQNIIDKHPEVAVRLAEGYEKWWQSFLNDKVDQKYAYIKVGSPDKNPTKISALDLLVVKYSPARHQNGAINGVQSGGYWKIEFVEDGEYSISLRRFPRESGLAINATFPAQEERIELDRIALASTKADFTEASLCVANVDETVKIAEGQEEITFKAYIPAEKYDMEARLIDEANRIHPAYYLYIEKI